MDLEERYSYCLLLTRLVLPWWLTTVLSIIDTKSLLITLSLLKERYFDGDEHTFAQPFFFRLHYQIPTSFIIIHIFSFLYKLAHGLDSDLSSIKHYYYWLWTISCLTLTCDHCLLGMFTVIPAQVFRQSVWCCGPKSLHVLSSWSHPLYLGALAEIRSHNINLSPHRDWLFGQCYFLLKYHFFFSPNMSSACAEETQFLFHVTKESMAKTLIFVQVIFTKY